MPGDQIPKDHADEVADCFVRYAQGLFGYACVLTRGDRALADDLEEAETLWMSRAAASGS